jgi:hypothetical protein
VALVASGLLNKRVAAKLGISGSRECRGSTRRVTGSHTPDTKVSTNTIVQYIAVTYPRIVDRVEVIPIDRRQQVMLA